MSIAKIVKKVKEMSVDIQKASSLGAHLCDAIAMGLYDEGYRKQRKGVWISVDGDVIFKCSICEAEISTSWDYENEDMFSYCPCCGANMTGGAE